MHNTKINTFWTLNVFSPPDYASIRTKIGWKLFSVFLYVKVTHFMYTYRWVMHITLTDTVALALHSTFHSINTQMIGLPIRLV